MITTQIKSKNNLPSRPRQVGDCWNYDFKNTLLLNGDASLIFREYNNTLSTKGKYGPLIFSTSMNSK